MQTLILGGGKGLGEPIRVAASQLQTPRVFSLILYLSLLGLALYALVTETQRRVVFWQGDTVGGARGRERPADSGRGAAGLRREGAVLAGRARRGRHHGREPDGRADLLGHDTHGVFRPCQHLARLKGGGCNPVARIGIVHERAATALIDGDDGLGHLAMSAARELAIAKAREAGIGRVGIRRGDHAGPLALHVRAQAEAGMIGMAAAVGGADHVPPFGGTDLLLGTDPVAISAPSGGDDPFVLDMASTVAATGRIKVPARRGETMPEGWMVGRDGEPLTDPARRSEGVLSPIGGPEGFGLSVAVGLVAGVLDGAAFGPDVIDFAADASSETDTGQFDRAAGRVEVRRRGHRRRERAGRRLRLRRVAGHDAP